MTLSLVGEILRINSTYGPLHTYGVQALNHFGSKWFLAENVGGLKSANQGRAFRLILKELQNAGYVMTPGVASL